MHMHHLARPLTLPWLALPSAADGGVLTFGRGASGQLGRACEDQEGGLAEAPGAVVALAGRGITQVALGEEHAAAVDADGRVYTWGAGEFGQLGIGSGKVQMRPVQVKGALQGVRVVQVSAIGAVGTRL